MPNQKNKWPLVITFLITLFIGGGIGYVVSDYLKPGERIDESSSVVEYENSYIASSEETPKNLAENKTPEAVRIEKSGDQIEESKQGKLLINTRRQVVRFKESKTEEEIEQLEEKYAMRLLESNIKANLYVFETEESIEGLVEEENAIVEVDTPVKMLGQTIDWGVERIGSTSSWEIGSGSGIIVAVIDTGIDLDHPDLDGNVLSGYDYVNDDNEANDDHGHGTHVAGIVAATNNGIGTVGNGYGSNLMPVKVLNADGYGYTSDVAEGIYYAVDNGAQVINMSLGSSESSEILHEAVKYAYKNNVLVIGAAGNAGSSSCVYPAAYAEVVCVGATDKENRLASFSNRGVEITAPGVSNYSTYVNNSYAYLSGTSMASPHVAGAAAIIMQVKGLTASDARGLLRESAADLGVEGKDDLFGYGLVDLVHALGIEDDTVDEEDEIEEPTEDEIVDGENSIPDETEEPDVDKPDTDKEPRNPSDNNNENATDPGVILQKLTIYKPEDKRLVVKNSEIDTVEFDFGVKPVRNDSKLEMITITVDNQEVYNSADQEGEYDWNISNLPNGQYILHFVAQYDKGKQHERVVVEINMDGRRRIKTPGKGRVKGVKTFRVW